jgi:hypothetical protein
VIVEAELVKTSCLPSEILKLAPAETVNPPDAIVSFELAPVTFTVPETVDVETPEPPSIVKLLFTNIKPPDSTSILLAVELASTVTNVPAEIVT